MAKQPTPDIASLGVRERILLSCVGRGTDGSAPASPARPLRHWWCAASSCDHAPSSSVPMDTLKLYTPALAPQPPARIRTRCQGKGTKFKAKPLVTHA
jgi:hypothetical protein